MLKEEQRLEPIAKFLTKYCITPVIATLSLVLYCITTISGEPPLELLLLVCVATWCIYMLDHYFDGRSSEGGDRLDVHSVSTPKYLWTILFVAGVNAVAALVLLPTKALVVCGGVCLLVVAHLLITNKTLVYDRVPFLKELAVSSIYSSGVFGLVLSYSYEPRLLDLWILGIVFGVVFCNVVLVSNKRNESIYRRIAYGGIAFSFVCLALRSFWFTLPYPDFGFSREPFIFLPGLFVVVAMLQVVRRSPFVTEAKRRMLADLAFIPIAYFGIGYLFG